VSPPIELELGEAETEEFDSLEAQFMAYAEHEAVEEAAAEAKDLRSGRRRMAMMTWRTGAIS
jgi:hypothetical protein